MKAQKAVADYKFLGAIVAILFFGLLVLTSSSSVIGLQKFGDSYFFVKRQLLYGVLPGIIAMYIFAKTDYHLWKRAAMLIFVLMIGVLLLPFLPGIGSTLGTAAHSWIILGNISLQPAEFAKLGSIIFLAAYMSHQGEIIANLKQGFLLTLGLGMIPIVLVILQPDIGTVSILFAILYAMLYFGRAKYSHLAMLAMAGIILFFIMIWAAPYRAARFITFLHPELDPQGQGYHINQAFLAIGSGGVFGLGLGHSQQKFAYLPEVHADSIFAVMAEELGFIVSTGFLILLVYIVIRGFQIAKHAPDTFGQLLVAGIISWFIIQSFLNIGAMLGLLPLTGVPLPFVSHGGTALMVALAAVGIIVNVSKQRV
ncbi:MAG: putative lipid II flippase FtsW [Candidatus Magasanikbacteria bacterium CG_4_9_14_0_2_um_filter_41_10]|uniref:Probable peptidoglycan glycosyltransferase FtsW n=1 Tax=Candidatus Magasanikbacteria bacterium CG_4_10_14_0_2_um_filter_41_31 TaxID=1974639 RepID=A0A2M7V362_9BACT|nr:MAG: putative lipid II flippase FtsW [Candidatus Magasanikbacteria bacterium CG1_02_41_34]PIZ92901.1 MAG: putative lipid II flippase FtsW [Candidatus Magasanikbacteria bacterium CG_4_10_14_0_2_um_filter_41_31]PJC53142.1 MAG: putative lipid II flippase FtsW [Candidatus Magasanikbacteria bacterium CG_4_9_14_0_2_um_filter_41_10]